MYRHRASTGIGSCRPDIRKRQLEQGYEPIGSPSEVYAQYLKREIDKYGKLIKDTGIVMN